jgi:hypothetical protein
LSDLTQPKLSTLLSKRLHKIFKAPSGFPNVQFDWVSEENGSKLTRLEASAPGSWELPHERRVHDVVLKASVPVEAPELQTSVTLDADFELGPHRFHGTAEFPGEFEFTAKLSNFALEHFLQSMASASDLLETIPAFWFSEADLVFNPATVAFQFRGRVDRDWKLPIGIKGLALTEIEVTLSREAGRPMTAPILGELRGFLTLADARIPVTHVLGAPVASFTGQASKLDVSQLIEQLCDASASRRIPFLYQQLLGQTAIRISVEQRTVFLQGEATGNFGPSAWLIEKRGGIWGYSLSPVLPSDWKLSRLAPFLYELNRLILTDPQLTISLFDDRAEFFPQWPSDSKDQIRAGINLVAEVGLSGLRELETLAKVCRLNGKIRMLGTLADRPTGRELVLESPLTRFRVGEIGEISDPVLSLRQTTDRPCEIAVDGPVKFQLSDSETLAFDGRAVVSGDQVELSAMLSKPLKEPFGIRGAKIERLQLEVVNNPYTGETGFHLAGRARLGPIQGSARVFWSEGVSSYQLRLAFDVLPIAVILSELAPKGVKIPAEVRGALEGGFREVEITATRGATAIRAKLQLFGKPGNFHGTFGEDSGLRAFGSFEPLHWMRIAGGRHVFELTRGEPEAFSEIDPDAVGSFPGGESGPLIRLALGTEKPGVQLAAQATLFAEFTRPVFAESTRKGATFPYRFENEQLNLDLQCQVDETGFTANGEIAFGVDTRFDLVEPKSGCQFASLQFEARLKAKLALVIGVNFEANLTGELDWRGNKIPVAKIVLTETPTKFADFQLAVVEVLRERAFSMLFKSSLGQTATFFGAVRDGWVQTGRALELSASQLTQALRNALGPTATDVTAILRELGFSWVEIAMALSEQFRFNVDAVAKPMKQTGASANEIAEVLYVVFTSGADACAVALRGAGFDHLQIGTALHLAGDAPPVQLAKALRGSGSDSNEIVQVLRSVCQVSLEIAYRAIHDAGFKALDAMNALRGICDTDRSETEQLLAQAGWGAREVRVTIDKSFETLGGMFG